MKRLLAISWSLPPILGARAVQVGRTLHALATRDWQVTVITVDPHSVWPRPRLDLELAANYLKHLNVIRVPAPKSQVFTTLLRTLFPSRALMPDDQAIWGRSVVDQVRQDLANSSYDCLLTFGQPWSDHLAGRVVQQQLQIPWAAHFADPWADNPYLQDRSQAQKQQMQELEETVVRDAAALVFTNQATVELVMAKYPEKWKAKAHAVPHGYDRDILLEATTAQSPAKPKKMHVVHTGNLYGLRSPVGLLKALRLLKAGNEIDGNIEVSFIGRAKALGEWQSLVQGYGLENQVHFLPPLSYKESLAAASKADVLLVIDAPNELESVFLPSKLVDYLMLQKPILGLTPEKGVTADLLRELGQAFVSPTDVDAIAATLLELYSRWKRRKLKVGAKFNEIAPKYDIGYTTAQLESILLALV